MEACSLKSISVAQTDILDKKKNFSFYYLIVFYSYVCFKLLPRTHPVTTDAVKQAALQQNSCLPKMTPTRFFTEYLFFFFSTSKEMRLVLTTPKIRSLLSSFLGILQLIKVKPNSFDLVTLTKNDEILSVGSVF